MADGKVLVVMGSDSDFPVMEGCFKMLNKFGVEFKATVASAHRTPDKAMALARGAEAEGFKVIIAAAGLAAHLGQQVLDAEHLLGWLRGCLPGAGIQEPMLLQPLL